jgi:diguanylate cyclase (GGDEF)-like protein
MVTHPEALEYSLACMCAMLAGFFVYLYFEKRKSYLISWAWAWVALALVHIPVDLHGPFGSERISEGAIANSKELLLFVAALVFLKAARTYAHAVTRLRWLLAAVVVAAVWVMAFRRGWVGVPLRLGVLFVFLLVARQFFLEGKKQQVLAETLMAVVFGTWGLIVFVASLQSHLRTLQRVDFHLLLLLPLIAIALLMVVVNYEEERRGLEGNILALSNLNVTASSFADSEIQRMLSQALDRVLTIGRLHSGILSLQYGEEYGSRINISSGLTGSVSEAFRERELEEYTLKLVARLGGLVVLRDLSRQSSWQALDREPAFRRVRKLLVDEGLKSAVGISLQSKERVFGFMLLGAAQNRHMTPPELRLLMALGQQIGLAIENGYLIQQTARRTDELHTLNEIGRALSSTLEAESIIEKISTGVRRLFENSQFYIALYDSARQELSIELEIRDGEEQPKRRLPLGNHLIEHIIRTKQPLLIRERFSEELERLRVIPREGAGSYCGIPLLLNDRALGAMALFSTEEGAFDEGHVEMLRVLASEASIALENARLFQEQQVRARQLALLNIISRQAISTLNSDEMLDNIAAALEEGLAYDHIGIALLESGERRLVVRAEAGSRRGALGRGKQIGEGLIGRAAISGEAEVLRGDAIATGQTILTGSVSAAALPVRFADQLQGVLYVETADTAEFPDEQLRLLHTLADLLAIALHNAYTFQQAQEQAITDGLTGLKTHRYLMEALSAEWKRSTRAGRPFSLVMLDLDGFKLVNDSHGHLEGDLVLQIAARILEQNCRRSDIVARYGGDEFVILMPETSAEQARQIASKLRGWIAGERMLRNKNVTASFGIASFPVHGPNPEQLIQAADAAMYVSKRSGGNMVSDLESSPVAEPAHPENTTAC